MAHWALCGATDENIMKRFDVMKRFYTNDYDECNYALFKDGKKPQKNRCFRDFNVRCTKRITCFRSRKLTI